MLLRLFCPLTGLSAAGDPGGAWRCSIVLSDQQLSHCQLSTQRVMGARGKAEKKVEVPLGLSRHVC